MHDLFQELASRWLLIPLIIGFIRYRHLFKAQRILFLLIVISGLVETAAIIIGYYGGQNNLPILHGYTVVEFSLLAWIFHLELRSFLGSWIIPGIIGGFIAFAIINATVFQKLTEFNTYMRSAEGFLVIGMIISYFYISLKELQIQHLHKSFHFWLSTGLFMYFSGNLVLFLYTNKLLVLENAELMPIFTVHAGLSILNYSIYSIALMCKL